MLSAYVNASNMEGAEKFFKRLKDDRLQPNVVTYGTLMKGYAKENDLEKVMQVYERMRMEGVEANQTIFTTIMDAHGKNSDFGSAVIWFKEMCSRGLPPDQKAKNILLSLAKAPEEQAEARVLVGESVSKLSLNTVNELSQVLDDDGEQEEDDDVSAPDLGNTTGEKLNEFDDDDEDDEDDVDTSLDSFDANHLISSRG